MSCSAKDFQEQVTKGLKDRKCRLWWEAVHTNTYLCTCGMQIFFVVGSGGSRGGSGGSFKPPSLPPVFLISYENGKIWSQWDQIISYSWDI